MGPDAAEDPQGLAASGAAIRHILNSLDADPSRVALGGFSMGGGCSLYTVLGPPGDLVNIAGVFSMSSWLTTRSAAWHALESRRRSCLEAAPVAQAPARVSAGAATPAVPMQSPTEGSDTDEASQRVAPPVFMSHGDRDGLIAPSWGAATRDGLRECGVSVKWVLERGLDHEPGPESLAALLEWILDTIPEA